MVSTFAIDSVGRDSTGADILTIVGENADAIAGGIAVMTTKDGQIFNTAIIAAVNFNGTTRVTLPIKSIDFERQWDQMVVEIPDPVVPEKSPSLLGRLASFFGK